jgi:hypothetical protein
MASGIKLARQLFRRNKEQVNLVAFLQTGKRKRTTKDVVELQGADLAVVVKKSL